MGDLKMRYVAAYLLAALGGNTSPSAKDIKDILGSVGIEADDERLNKVISELNGKDINEVMNSGLSKFGLCTSRWRCGSTCRCCWWGCWSWGCTCCCGREKGREERGIRRVRRRHGLRAL